MWDQQLTSNVTHFCVSTLFGMRPFMHHEPLFADTILSHDQLVLQLGVAALAAFVVVIIA
jgi:hypothetical protein